MNKREAAVFTAYTGKMFGKFEWFHEYAQELMNQPIWTHQFASKELWAEIKKRSEPEFLRINQEAIEKEEAGWN